MVGMARHASFVERDDLTRSKEDVSGHVSGDQAQRWRTYCIDGPLFYVGPHPILNRILRPPGVRVISESTAVVKGGSQSEACIVQ